MPYPGAQSDPPDNGLPEYPHDLLTRYLVPNFGTKPRVRKKQLLAVAEDGTRTGRIKSGTTYTFDLVYKRRELAEYLTLVSFWETQGYHLGFNYYDMIQHDWFTMYFDSEIEAEYSSFNELDFTVTVTTGVA